MTCIGIFVGQCGVSIGLKLIDDTPTAFLAHTGHPHFIFIDTEIKVINKLYEKNVVCPTFKMASGCAGCYAKGTAVYRENEAVLEALITKELERVDCCTGFIIFHSICGGTGSGVGSELTKFLKSSFPTLFVINVVIIPFSTGENPIQSYNYIHTLSHLQINSDMIIYVDNLEISNICHKSSKKFGMDALNNQIIQDLRILFDKVHSIPNRFTFSEFLKSLSPLPSTKFVCMTSRFWHDQSANIDSCLRFVKEKTRYGKDKSISGVVMTTSSIVPDFDKYSSRFSKAFNFVEWNPFPDEYWFVKHNKNQGINVAVNSSAIRNSLDDVSQVAKVKFDVSAYLHCYEKYGIGKNDFIAAFEGIKSIQNDYYYMCK